MRVVEPLRVAASYIEQIGRGEIPEKISDTYNGDFNEIKNDINSCIDGLGGLVEGKTVLEKMALNNFAIQVEGSYQGIFKDIADSMNQVCRRIDRTVNVVENAANGDLSDLAGLQKLGARCPGRQTDPDSPSNDPNDLRSGQRDQEFVCQRRRRQPVGKEATQVNSRGNMPKSY